MPCKFSGGIRVKGLALFKHDRDLGMTQMEKAKEQQDESRADGKDIMRVRGRRTATQVYRNGSWERS